ncbi:MAG: gliding motility-associated ABC transporter permease subunit GldF [Bacteroidota bacterium]
MIALYKKEISSFFSNLTGYIVITVFLVITGLFLWVFPGQNNILDVGYASLSPLFELAPWIFLFLVPAVTMRVFAEEKRTGTLETLLTRPLSELEIILAKYLASLTLVLVALLPSLVYYFTVYYLAAPTGNIDVGGIWGSYLGLLFLASVYVAIGVLASVISENQIVSFLVAIVITFFIYLGFDFLSSLAAFEAINDVISKLGIEYHYQSMSRGVIDSRDVIYFLAVNALFISLTRLVLLSRKW